MKFATKPIRHYPPHLRHVATVLHYIGKLKIRIFSAHMEENATKWLTFDKVTESLKVGTFWRRSVVFYYTSVLHSDDFACVTLCLP